MFVLQETNSVSLVKISPHEKYVAFVRLVAFLMYSIIVSFQTGLDETKRFFKKCEVIVQ